MNTSFKLLTTLTVSLLCASTASATEITAVTVPAERVHDIVVTTLTQEELNYIAKTTLTIGAVVGIIYFPELVHGIENTYNKAREFLIKRFIAYARLIDEENAATKVAGVVVVGVVAAAAQSVPTPA